MKNRIRSFSAVSALLFLVAAQNAKAFVGDVLSLPPHAGYQKFETDHFEVIYPEKYSAEAKESAPILEETYSVLTRAFQYSPSHKCTIILADNNDFANGITSAIGLQGIVLYLTAPDPYSSIGEYDHWLKNLIVHEYSHYLTLEQTRGIFAFGRYVFGNLLLPNHAWPNWIAEGMAVYAESKFTQRGRGHGTYYSTLTRDGLSRDTLGTSKFLSFDKITGPVPYFPFGESHYYAGYGMIDEMMEQLGPDAPARFAEESSWRIPFFNNGTLENMSHERATPARSSHNEPTVDSFQDLWQSFIDRSRRTMDGELKWLRAHGAPDPRFFSDEGESALGARLSPDKSKIASILASGHERSGIVVVERASGHKRKIDEAISGANLAWSDDGKHLYYGKTDFRSPYTFYSDLYDYDFETESVRRITVDQRAKDPGFCIFNGSPALVFTTQTGRVSELKRIDLKTQIMTSLYRAPDDHHVANPRCTADQKDVVFSEHGTVPLDEVRKVGLDGSKSTKLFGGPDEKFGALFPEPVPNGDIYFTQVRDGYYELARWDHKSKTVSLVARSTGGYWLPSFVDGEMAVSYVSSTGIRAGLVDPKQLETQTLSALAKAPLIKPSESPSSDTQTLSQSFQVTPAKGYNLLTSLAPRIWSPYLVLSDGQNQYGFSLVGWDDLDQLEYNIFAWYDTLLRGPEGVFSTFHRIKTFKLQFTASSQINAFLITNLGRIYDNERKLSARLSRPFPGAFSSITPALVGEWARTFRDGDYRKYTFQPDQRFGLDLTFDSRQRYGYSIASESGTLVNFSGRRLFSSRASAWKGLINVQQLIPLYPRHSALSLTGWYGVAPSPTDDLTESSLRVGGRGTSSDLDPPLRGYPLGNFDTRRVGILQSEYRVPLAQVFHGFGTWPIFLQNLGAYGFYDAAKIQLRSGSYSQLIDSTGGGLILNTELAYAVPVQINIEFAHGFKQYLNGQNSITLNFGL